MACGALIVPLSGTVAGCARAWRYAMRCGRFHASQRIIFGNRRQNHPVVRTTTAPGSTNDGAVVDPFNPADVRRPHQHREPSMFKRPAMSKRIALFAGVAFSALALTSTFVAPARASEQGNTLGH